MMRRNSGFTLVELTVVLAILGIIGGAIGALLIRQQRFYRGASEMLYARQGVRDALEVLATDLRGISAADTVRLLADSAIEIFAPIGGSVVCQGAGGADVALPPVSTTGSMLTWLLSQPDTGDLALFYHDDTASVGHWERHRITGFSSRSLASICPAASGLARQEDIFAGRQGFEVSLDAPLSSGVLPGAPVRFIRRGRYSLYRASDGDWYLGYRRCNAIGSSVCGAIQPLSGPYRSYSSNPAGSGLLFEYFDSHGARLDASSPLDLARIDISARAESKHRIGVEGHAFTPSDSATLSIAIRNRAR